MMSLFPPAPPRYVTLSPPPPPLPLPSTAARTPEALGDFLRMNVPALAVADLGVVDVSGDTELLGVAGFEEEATAGLCDRSMDCEELTDEYGDE